MIGDLAVEGLGVIVVSSYLPEVLGLADRVLVMREGSVAGELSAEGATEEDVLRLASLGGPGASRETAAEAAERQTQEPTTPEETGA